MKQIPTVLPRATEKSVANKAQHSSEKVDTSASEWWKLLPKVEVKSPPESHTINEESNVKPPHYLP